MKFSPEETALVDETVRDTLLSWLLTGEIDELPEEERHDALRMGRHWLKPDGRSPDEVWSAWGGTLVRLVRFYRDGFLLKQAVETAEEFAASRPGGWPVVLVRVDWQLDISEVLSTFGDHQHAAQILRSLKVDLEKTGPMDAARLRELGVVCWQLGDVELLCGQTVAALEASREGLVLFRRLAAKFGETPDNLRNVAISLNRVSRVERDFKRARTASREGLRLFKRLVVELGATPQSLNDVNISLGIVCNVELSQQNYNSALAACDEGLAICKRLIDEFGVTPKRLRAASISYITLAHVKLSLGKYASALSASSESIALAQQLVAEFGSTPERLRGLAISYLKVADVHLKLENRESALATYRESLALRQRIATEFGETHQSLRDIGVVLIRLADLSSGNHKEALAAHHDIFTRFKRIVDEFGKTPESLRDMMAATFKLAIAEGNNGDNASAVERLRRAQQLKDQLKALGWHVPKDNEEFDIIDATLWALTMTDSKS